jgi:arsenate reductase
MGKLHFGYLITVCARAEEQCPRTFPDVSQRLHSDIEDPAAFQGAEEAKLQQFREARDEVERRVRAWLAEV